MKKLLLILSLFYFTSGFAQTKIDGTQSSSLNSETSAYLSAVIKAGGYVSYATLSSIDRFVTRGKSAGWFSLAKEIWIPSGDFTASQLKLVSTTSWTFNNFVAADYAESTGYLLPSNSTKYIATGFIPNSQGLTNQNISLAFASTVPTTPAGFGRVVGTATVADAAPFISATENKASTGGSIYSDMAYLPEATSFVTSSNSTNVFNYLNGTYQTNFTNVALSGLTDEINIYRSFRSSLGMQYATGGIGFYWIGSTLTQAQALDLNLAIMALMRDLRDVWKKPNAIFFGDSITEGTGSTNGVNNYANILCKLLGLRLQNNAQGSTVTNDTYSVPGYISGIDRYVGLYTQPSQLLFLMYGTNDLSSDVATNGTQASANAYGASLNTMCTNLLAYNHRVVLAIPPYNTSTNATKMTMYITQVVTTAKNLLIKLVDFYDMLLDTGNPTAYLADAKHPNPAGHLLMAQLAYAVIQGKPYRDALIPATVVAANSSVTQAITMYGAKNNTNYTIGNPTVTTAGITYSVAWTSNDTFTVTITNSTGSPVTTNACNIRIQMFIDYLS